MRKIRNRKTRQKILKDLKMLHGLPPYDGPENICLNDAYFARSLERDYGMSLSEIEKEVDFDKILQRDYGMGLSEIEKEVDFDKIPHEWNTARTCHL